MELSKYIDHTLLKPEATLEQIRKLCEEAAKFDFYSVCVNSVYVPICKEFLTALGAEEKVKICSVIGFPLGAMDTQSKAFETMQAVQKGASEIDMVIHIGALKDKKYTLVENDIKAVVQAAVLANNNLKASAASTHKSNPLVKVIIETALLNDSEKVKACELALSAGAHFVKTCTGFSGGGATVEDIELMKKIVGNKMQVKASGGIKTPKQAWALIEAGANRLGTSAGVALIQGENIMGGY